MSKIVISGSFAGQVQEDGSPWPYALVIGEETLLTDSPTDICEVLIEGYENIPASPEGDDEALLARVEAAMHYVSLVQSMLASDAAVEGTLDTSDEELLTALFGDRTYPLVGIEEWKYDVPLVLNAIDYSPYVDNPPPTGKVLWVDPSDETQFIHSLMNLGLLHLYVQGASASDGEVA